MDRQASEVKPVAVVPASNRGGRTGESPSGAGEKMKTPTMSYQLYNQDLMDDFGGSSVGMEVDDGDPLEILGAAAEFEKQHQPPPIDADFFNSFEDDFDDSDVA